MEDVNGGPVMKLSSIKVKFKLKSRNLDVF
jgi:hypothetical protein